MGWSWFEHRVRGAPPRRSRYGLSSVEDFSRDGNIRIVTHASDVIDASDDLTGASQPTPASPALQPAQQDAESAGDTRRLALRNGVTIATVTAIALGILLLQSLVKGHLTALDEYDDGAYFGASLQLLHGLLPYRNFAFIQPPLVSVWMLPSAAVSLVAGTATALETGRLFIDLVATCNVLMVGLLVRRRPTLQVIVSMAAMAAFPGMVRSAQTVLLEPLLVFGCLAGLLCLFEGERLRRSWLRIVFGGLLFGLAGATKLWAIFPFLAVLVVALRLGRWRWLALVFSGAAGFIGASLPFFLGAQNAFIQQVFVTQAIRNGSGYAIWQRLADLTGFPGLYTLVTTTNKHPTPGTLQAGVLIAVLVALVVVGLLAFSGRARRRIDALEWFALLATVLTAAGLLVAPTYYYHYAGFEAPFIALLYGAVVVRLRARLSQPRVAGTEPSSGESKRRRLPRLVGVFFVTAIPVVLIGTMIEARIDLIETASPQPQVASAVGKALPRHGCVLYTDIAIGILADRYTADKPGCPDVVDYLAQERVLDHGRANGASNARDSATQTRLLAWMKVSIAVVGGDHPGWGAKVRRYLYGHFHEVHRGAGGSYVFVRDGVRRV